LSSKLFFMSTTYLIPSLFLPDANWSQAQEILLAFTTSTSGQIWCLAQNSTHSSVSLIPPINVPDTVQWFIYNSTWLNSIGLVTSPNWHNTPCFFRHRKMGIISWCDETVLRIKSHEYPNDLKFSTFDVQQNSVAPFSFAISSLCAEELNTTTWWPAALAILIPIVPSPPTPTIPIFIFFPSKAP